MTIFISPQALKEINLTDDFWTCLVESAGGQTTKREHLASIKIESTEQFTKLKSLQSLTKNSQ